MSVVLEGLDVGGFHNGEFYSNHGDAVVGDEGEMENLFDWTLEDQYSILGC